MREKWKPEEDEIIKQNYLTMEAKDILKLLPGRTIASLRGRIQVLGLSALKNIWPEEEIEELKKYFLIENRKKLMERFPKYSYRAICDKANELNLYKEKVRWTPDKIEILKQYYGKEPTTETAKRLGDFSIDSIRSKASELELTNKYFDFWSEESIEILKENYNKLTIEEIMVLIPGKSAKTIREKAFQLDLTQPKICWTPEKVEILKQYCSIEIMSELQKKFPEFTEEQIKNKIYNLGLTLYDENSNYWTPERIEELKQYYPIEGGEAYKRFPGKSKESIQSKAHELGIKVLNRQYWTPEAEEIMRQYYPLEGGKVAERLPGYKPSNIYSKAKSMGLVYRTQKPWTDDEKEILKEFYPSLNKEELMKLFPERAYISIVGEANSLGVYKDKRWSDKEVKILKKFYPDEGPKVIDKIPNRTKASIINKANKLGITYRDEIIHWTEDEIDILKKYYDTENIVKLARRLPRRTYNAIQSKLYYLGLIVVNNKETYFKDKQEENIVVETHNNEVKTVINNTPTFSSKLRKWKVEDVEVLETYYPIEGTAVINRLKNYTMNQIREAAKKLGLKTNNMNEPWAVEEDYLACEFYLKHVNDWNTKESVEELHRIFISKGFLTHGIKTIHMKLANCSYIHTGIGLEHASQQNIDVYNKLTGGNLFTRFFRWLRRIFKI